MCLQFLAAVIMLPDMVKGFLLFLLIWLMTLRRGNYPELSWWVCVTMRVLISERRGQEKSIKEIHVQTEAEIRTM